MEKDDSLPAREISSKQTTCRGRFSHKVSGWIQRLWQNLLLPSGKLF